jgi:glycosyltransferase involved in cell wall biosynthesis
MSIQNKKNIITVVNQVSETSMPVNEFVRFRQKNYGEEGTVLTLNKIGDSLKKTFSTIKMYSFSENPKKFIGVLFNSSKSIIHNHQPRSALLVSFLTLILPKRFKIVTTVHNDFTTFNKLNKFIILINLFFSKAICFVSDSSYQSFPSFFKKLWKKKIHVITNGVNIASVDAFIDTQEKDEKEHERIELINVGKLRQQKNHEQLLRIMAKLPKNYHLTIIGAGSEEKHLLKMIKELEIEDKITMTGLIPREEVYRYLINSDIFINPALWEGMPIGVLEAMACRLPVLLSDIPPHKEIENHSDEKFICLSDKEYIDQIIKYSHYTEDELKEVGLQNRKVVECFYSLSSMHKKYDEVYNKVNIIYA